MSMKNLYSRLKSLSRTCLAKAVCMAPIICFGLTGAILPASASATTKIEAVATVEVVHGFLNKYYVGLSFANANDCNAKIGQLNLVLQNLHALGVTKGNKSITLSCEEIGSVTVR